MKHYLKHSIFSFIIFSALISASVAAEIADEKKSPAMFSYMLPYAEFANAIYEEENILTELILQRHLKLNEVKNITGVEVSYALLTDSEKKLHIVVVRGTANVENAFVDMNIKLVADEQTGIRLHQGFLEASTPIFEKIKNKLNRDYAIITTGHSLGGAVAVILAMQFQSEGFNVSRVITFGQPKVTNISGANKFKNLNVTRVVRSKDLVPIVPPVDLIDMKNLDVYWHLGREIVLLENNEYTELEGMSSMLRSGDFVTTVPTQENLESHKMTGYLALVKDNSLKAKKVEYKSSFNLKNLFGSD